MDVEIIQLAYYRKTSNIIRTLGNKIVDNSDVVGASPVGVAPMLQLHLHSQLNTWLQWIERRQLQEHKNL